MTAFDRLRPYLARVLGTIVGSLAAWVAVHYGVKVGADTQQQLVDAIILIIIPIYSIVREITHKTIDKRLNPADSASGHLAVEGKRDAAEAKLAIK